MSLSNRIGWFKSLVYFLKNIKLNHRYLSMYCLQCDSFFFLIWFKFLDFSKGICGQIRFFSGFEGDDAPNKEADRAIFQIFIGTVLSVAIEKVFSTFWLVQPELKNILENEKKHL